MRCGYELAVKLADRWTTGMGIEPEVRAKLIDWAKDLTVPIEEADVIEDIVAVAEGNEHAT